MTPEQHRQGCDTQDKILDAAEALFIEKGFAGTSLRAIAANANVNLAATHYHFGSKQGLFAAVFHRRIHPINEARLRLLKRLLEDEKANKSEHLLTVRSILEAFFTPVLNAIPTEHSHIPALVGRLYSEPTTMSKGIMEDEFNDLAKAFQGALSQALPGVSEDAIRWRFHMMIGAMIHLLKFQAPLGIPGTPDTLARGIPELISFVEHGLTQESHRSHHD